jgi:hypothetical protein
MESFYWYVLGGLIITYLITYLFFKITNREPSLKKIKFWIAWIALSFCLWCVIMVVVIIMLFSSFPNYKELEKPFGIKAWLEKPEKRTEMIDDLLTKKILDKKSEPEVLILLGQPMDSYGNKGDSNRCFKCDLGNERNPFGVDSEWLEIWFKNDTVQKYISRTD